MKPLSKTPTRNNSVVRLLENSISNDDTNQKLLQDINIINSKIAEISGDIVTPTSTTSTSSSHSGFVNNLRSISNSDLNNPSEEKLRNLEKVLLKIIELDKAVLRKTIDTSSNDSESSVVRRSKSLDLFSLSTHMQVIDRLLDLYNKSRRLSQTNVIITNNSKPNDKNNNKLNISGEKISSPRSNTFTLSNPINSNTNLQNQINKLTKQLDESESKRKLIDSENNTLKKKLSTTQSELKTSKDNYDNLFSLKQNNINELNHQINDLLLKYDKFENNFFNMLQDKIILYNQNNSDKISYQKYNLPSNILTSLETLDQIISNKSNNNNNDMSLSSLKEIFENEIASINLEKSLLQTDLGNIQNEYNSFKIAYQNLELEFQQFKNDMKGTLNQYEVDNNTMKSVIEKNNNQINQLSNDIIDLTTKNFILNDEKISLDNKVKILNDEIIIYQDNNNKLKDKIKLLSNNKEEFFDTFEEVMKDEMLTMKKSFEEKLKLAKEEADERTRLHTIEIQKLRKLNMMI